VLAEEPVKQIAPLAPDILSDGKFPPRLLYIHIIFIAIVTLKLKEKDDSYLEI